MALILRFLTLILGCTLLLHSGQIAAAPIKILTDRDILRMARTPLTKNDDVLMKLVEDSYGPLVPVGTYHGTPVIIKYTCSDLCPMYTQRTIEFNVPFEACAESGGQPISFNNKFWHDTEYYCFPKILVKRKWTTMIR